VGEEVIKCDERQLGLDVGVLCQVSARKRRARTWSSAIPRLD
jgi:hypothetical protein